MLTDLLDRLGSWPPALVLTVVAVVLFCESGFVVGVVLPGSTTLVVLGVWSAAADTPAALPIVVAATASVCGALAGWLRGHGRQGLAGHRRLRARADVVVRRSRGWLSTQGPGGTTAVIAAAHWVAVTRTLVPRVAGGAGVPLRLAGPVIAVSGAAWATTIILLARGLGQRVADDAGWVPLLVLVVLAVVLAVRTWVRARQARTHDHALPG